MWLETLVRDAIRYGASDIHLTAGRYPTLRIKGYLKTFTGGRLVTKTDLLESMQRLGLSLQKFEEQKYLDSGWGVDERRLRLHYYMTSDGPALSIRLLPRDIPKFEDLHLPEVVKKFVKYRNGLVIVTGATGSGKSTTLASLIEYVNETMNKKIVTVEDPIEYVYEDKKSLIVQRELGSHVNKFDDAVKQAMREDPDILLVGELRDLETMRSALTMAETGHLVFGTLHTRGAVESINRIIDVFPAEQQEQIRVQLANVVKGIISQQLITCKRTMERVPLCEVLVMNDAAKGIIAGKGHLSSLRDNIQQNHQRLRSQTFVQSAADLLKRRLIDMDDIVDIFDEEEMKKLKTMLVGRS